MAVRNSATLNDVARIAGVSAATVSRVLNRHPQIDDNTRSRVVSAIKEAGYDTAAIDRKVTAMAQAKAKQLKTYNFELLLCPLAEQKDMLTLEFFQEILNGIQSYFSHQTNVNLNICVWESDEDKYRRQNDMTFRRLQQADGVMITGNPNQQLLKALLNARINFLLLDNSPEDLMVNSIAMDNISGGIQAARYLLDQGFKRIGYLSGPLRVTSWNGYRRGAMMETAGRVGWDNFISRTAATTENTDFIKAISEWLDSGTCPNALIVSHLDAAETVLRCLQERGFSCPNDFSIITFFRNNKNPYPAWTHLELAPRQTGYNAAQRIMQIVTQPYNEDDQLHKIVIPMRFIEGATVKKLS